LEGAAVVVVVVCLAVAGLLMWGCLGEGPHLQVEVCLVTQGEQQQQQQQQQQVVYLA
jgi:hypothetical protein